MYEFYSYVPDKGFECDICHNHTYGPRNFTDKSGGKCCNECFNKIVFPKLIERLVRAVEKVQVEEIDPKSVPAGRAREYLKYKRRTK